MTLLSSARFVAIALGGIVAIHATVWGMAAMLTDMGEGPVLHWSAWWTLDGWRTSALVQARVGLVVGLFSLLIHTFMFGISKRALPWLTTGIMFAAVVIEAAILSTSGLGPSRGEINDLLGSFAHSGLTIGAALAASRWMEYNIERRFTIPGPATPRTR